LKQTASSSASEFKDGFPVDLEFEENRAVIQKAYSLAQAIKLPQGPTGMQQNVKASQIQETISNATKRTFEEHIRPERPFPAQAPRFPHPDYPQRPHTIKKQPVPPPGSTLSEYLADLREAIDKGDRARARFEAGLTTKVDLAKKQYMRKRGFQGTW